MSEIINVLLIINPCSGPDRKRPRAYDIIKLFPDNYSFVTEFTRKSGDAKQLVLERGSEADIIVCAGGDGTLNEVINGIMELDKSKPVGYIPVGSTNDLATTLGIPSKLDKAVQTILDGHLNEYDVGEFNGRYFTYTTAFGAMTKSSWNTSQKMKNRFGHIAYIFNGLTEWKNIPAIEAHVEYDEGEFDGVFALGTVTDSTSIAGIVKLDRKKVRLDDGKFELVMISALNNLLEAPAMLRKFQKQDYDEKAIFLYHTHKAKITFKEPISWTIDGENAGEHQEVEIVCHKRAVKIFSPKVDLFDGDGVMFEKK